MSLVSPSRRAVLLTGLLCLTLLAVIAWPLSAQEALDRRFGVIESYESPAEATALGVAWTRVTFNWAEIQEGGPDSWVAPLSEEQLAAEAAGGRMVVGLLIGIPQWARDRDDLPQGLSFAYDDPANRWAAFVRQVVGRYAGKIDHWIIWNEPDIAETAIAHTWDGNVADFAQLQRVAYLAAGEANPAAVIHLSAFTYWADYYGGTEQYMARLIDEIMTDPEATGHNYYFDVATAHLYFQPNQVYDLLQLFIGIMRERGLSQPIWLVETNAPPKDDPAWPVPNWTLSVTLNEQAAFLPQVLASALAAGAERIAVYKLQDTADDRAANPEPFGLLRQDGSRRPAFDAYRIAMRHLKGMVGIERERWDEVGQIRVDQVGQTTTVLFARLPQPQQAQVPATGEEAVLTDMWGTKQVITPTEGLYTVGLPAARCSQSIGDYCMIGGFTYYLVQPADIAAPTETPAPSNTPKPSSSPTATATAAPTGTPTLPVPATAEATQTANGAAAAGSSLIEANPAVTALSLDGTPVTAKPPAGNQVSPPEDGSSIGYWTLGGGILLALLLAGCWLLARRWR